MGRKPKMKGMTRSVFGDAPDRQERGRDTGLKRNNRQCEERKERIESCLRVRVDVYQI
jgi:hypothetical protein